jgi:hypothetical protein
VLAAAVAWGAPSDCVRARHHIFCRRETVTRATSLYNVSNGSRGQHAMHSCSAMALCPPVRHGTVSSELRQDDLVHVSRCLSACLMFACLPAGLPACVRARPSGCMPAGCGFPHVLSAGSRGICCCGHARPNLPNCILCCVEHVVSSCNFANAGGSGGAFLVPGLIYCVLLSDPAGKV